MEPEQKTSIRHALQNCRQESLVGFMGDFILLLNQEGFSLEDFMQALASWAHQQKNIPDSAVKCLENALTQLHSQKQ